MDNSIVDEYLFQFILALFMCAIGWIQFQSSQRQKAQTNIQEEQIQWMRNMDKEAKEQSKTLVRIETRLENFEELKKRQEHDHKEMRGLSDGLSKIESRVDRLEERMGAVVQYCRGQHGMDPDHS